MPALRFPPGEPTVADLPRERSKFLLSLSTLLLKEGDHLRGGPWWATPGFQRPMRRVSQSTSTLLRCALTLSQSLQWLNSPQSRCSLVSRREATIEHSYLFELRTKRSCSPDREPHARFLPSCFVLHPLRICEAALLSLIVAHRCRQDALFY